MARVIVSAGHTQEEPGVVKDGLREVDFTNKISQKVTTKLRQNGIITLSVPPELELEERIDWINRTGYSRGTDDICIEIHINDGGKSGVEVWCENTDEGKQDEDNASYNLAKSILDEACKSSGLNKQGVKKEEQHPLRVLQFLRKTSPVACLVECLYIDHPEDQKFLQDDSKLDLLAAGVVNGILKYFEVDVNPQSQAPATSSMSGFGMGGATYPRTPGYVPPPAPMASPSFPSYASPSPYGAGGYGGAYPPVGGAMQGPQSREDRKKMIKEKYQQILGRKVSDQDLNYFVNLGLTEDQMIRRVVESQEHADMITAAQEHKKIKPEYDRLKTEVQRLEVQLRDKESLLTKQNDLLVQKNKSISALEHSTPNMIPVEPASSLAQLQVERIPSQRESLVDRVLKRLNDIFD